MVVINNMEKHSTDALGTQPVWWGWGRMHNKSILKEYTFELRFMKRREEYSSHGGTVHVRIIK